MFSWLSCNTVLCNVIDGDVTGGTEKLIGEAENENACVLLVQQERGDTATGMRYSTGDKKCWAETGTTIHANSLYRACIWKGRVSNLYKSDYRNNREHNMTFIECPFILFRWQVCRTKID